MAESMPAPSARADRLARAGLLGTYTLLARRAARQDLEPQGPAGGPTQLHSESFGFAARLPPGWVRQSVESLHVAGRGTILLQDLEVRTPEGVRVRVGAVVEPELPSPDAIEEVVHAIGGGSGAGLVTSELGSDGPFRDVVLFGEERTLAVGRVAIVGRRVLVADAWLDSEAGDDVVRTFFDELVLVPVADATDGRPSGTYRSATRR